MRISVETILSMLAQGETFESLRDDYPGLEVDDIRACLAYAHAVVAQESLDDVEIARTTARCHAGTANRTDTGRHPAMRCRAERSSPCAEQEFESHARRRQRDFRDQCPTLFIQQGGQTFQMD